MNVYLVQPMRNRTKEEIMSARERGIKVVKALYPDCTILDNYFEDYDKEIPATDYLARSCELLSKTDLMVLLPFYYGVPGCDLEGHIAEVYKIPRLIINFIPGPDGKYGQAEGGLF